ncbi:MAG TPA: ATP-binding cassette domain-containing protein [Xanthobacteraceae bacterium]|nr:ATP-binding cassette domain-containing protein [Xanthobacteraceae bacterium]
MSFEVHKGETGGIIGRNGAGESTLLELLCGTQHPCVARTEPAAARVVCIM